MLGESRLQLRAELSECNLLVRRDVIQEAEVAVASESSDESC